MDAKQAGTLKVGDRVEWDLNGDDLGTVAQVSLHAVEIKWDNGEVGAIDKRGCQRVERAED